MSDRDLVRLARTIVACDLALVPPTQDHVDARREYGNLDDADRETVEELCADLTHQLGVLLTARWGETDPAPVIEALDVLIPWAAIELSGWEWVVYTGIVDDGGTARWITDDARTEADDE